MPTTLILLALASLVLGHEPRQKEIQVGQEPVILTDSDNQSRVRVTMRNGNVVVELIDANGAQYAKIQQDAKGNRTFTYKAAKGEPLKQVKFVGPPAARQRTKSRWDPPADLAHLQETTQEERARIDRLVKTMFDPTSGRDALVAKRELILMDKKAFPRILGAMANLRDKMTDEDTVEERERESTLKLADETLREMDGYLNLYTRPVVRPGTSKRYITYILRLHYRRWVKELSAMKKLPGPHSPPAPR